MNMFLSYDQINEEFYKRHPTIHQNLHRVVSDKKHLLQILKHYKHTGKVAKERRRSCSVKNTR